MNQPAVEDYSLLRVFLCVNKSCTMSHMKNVSPWFVYMVRCSDASLYSGVTTDVERRFKEHTESKKGSKYVRAKIPLRVVYTEPCASRSEAQIREAQLKKMKKEEKEALVKSQEPKKKNKKTVV